MTDSIDTTFIELAADIVSAYVSNNSVPASDLPNLIGEVHAALLRVTAGSAPVVVETPKPAVPPKKSITNDYIICLEDGRKLKMLKRYLRSRYDMSPDEYRRRWGLGADYPMVAPSYTERRSEFAKRIGLGKGVRKAR